MVKILRKSYENHETQFPINSVFIVQKSIFVVTPNKMLKMKFKFKYILLIT